MLSDDITVHEMTMRLNTTFLWREDSMKHES
jgi:hypothetical protein